jgi:hypothetical protein
MQVAFVLLLLVIAPVAFCQRFVSGPEEEGRLLVPKDQRILRSPACPDTNARVILRANIGEDGQVVAVKEVKQRSLDANYNESRFRQLVVQAKRLVLTTWRYRPTLIGGRPAVVSTFITVPCTPQ